MPGTHRLLLSEIGHVPEGKACEPFKVSDAGSGPRNMYRRVREIALEATAGNLVLAPVKEGDAVAFSMDLVHGGSIYPEISKTLGYGSRYSLFLSFVNERREETWEEYEEELNRLHPIFMTEKDRLFKNWTLTEILNDEGEGTEYSYEGHGERKKY